MRATVLASIVALAPATASAAGFYLYELGSPSVGLASAGYTARAGDAETVFTNPAGMTRLPRTELLVGVQALYGDVSFTPGPQTTVSGNAGGNALGWLPGGSAFFSMEVAPDVRVGLGALQYFGLGLEYEPGWVGRYYGQKGVLVGLSLQPTVAWKATDWLSVGAGLNAMLGIMRSTIAVNNALPTLADGSVGLSNDAWGFGANVGLLFTPGPTTRIGVTWLSQVWLGFRATPSWSGLGPGIEAALRASGLLTAPIGLGMTLPNRIMAGVHQDIDSRWSVMADAGFETWSQFGRVEVSVDTANPVSLTKTIAYQDTWHVAAGAQFRPDEAWTLSGGVAYDSSIMNDAQRTVLTPIGSAWRFALGAQWAISPTVTLGLQDTFIWGGTLPLQQDRGPLAGEVQGQYDGTLVNMLAVNARFVF